MRRIIFQSILNSNTSINIKSINEINDKNNVYVNGYLILKYIYSRSDDLIGTYRLLYKISPPQVVDV